jgi:hypothetical protein
LSIYFSIYMLNICSSFDMLKTLSSKQTYLKSLNLYQKGINWLNDYTNIWKTVFFVFYSEKYSLIKRKILSQFLNDLQLYFEDSYLCLQFNFSKSITAYSSVCTFSFEFFPLNSFLLTFQVQKYLFANCISYAAEWEFLTFKVQMVFNILIWHMPSSFIYGANLLLNQNWER